MTTEPTGPTGPADPTSPTVPAEPTGPTGPTEPTGPTQEPAPKQDTTTRSWLRDHSELGVCASSWPSAPSSSPTPSP